MNVAVLGYGTVGSGVVEVLTMNRDYINMYSGQLIDIRYVLDLRDFPGSPIENVLVHDFNTILEDPEVDIVAEVMGGIEPAYSFTKKLLLAGKAVCTSNKELVSRHGAELLAIAKENNTNYFFEASVGGGIPIIRPLNRSLTADNILEIKSIINGTTNYILTKMRDDGTEFDAALKEAQAKGYAERDPSADIDGLDACRKTAILASLANGKQVDAEDVYTEGISKITPADIRYAKKLRAEIKLLSCIFRKEHENLCTVSPWMIRSNCPLYSVNGVFNAVMVKGNAVGDLMFYGRGAGKLPTASAVVADIVEAAKHRHINVVTLWDEEKLELRDRKTLETKYFVRVPAARKAEAIARLGVTEMVEPEEGEVAFVTDILREGDFEEKSEGLEIISRIRADF